jgi:hypothetical protein
MAVLAQTKAALGKIYNDETTTGKSGKTLIWSAGSVLVVTLLTAITGNPALFTWHQGILVTVANVLLVLLKNVLDSGTPNI